jgi:hypothetical protein
MIDEGSPDGGCFPFSLLKSDTVDHLFKLPLHLSDRIFQRRIAGGLHRGDGVDGRHVHPSVFYFLHDNEEESLC